MRFDLQKHPGKYTKGVTLREAQRFLTKQESDESGLQLKNKDGELISELIFYSLNGSGLGKVILYFPPNQEDERFLLDPSAPRTALAHKIYPGGNEWLVPEKFFCSEELVSNLVGEFFKTKGRCTAKYILLGGDEDTVEMG